MLSSLDLGGLDCLGLAVLRISKLGLVAPGILKLGLVAQGILKLGLVAQGILNGVTGRNLTDGGSIASREQLAVLGIDGKSIALEEIHS